MSSEQKIPETVLRLVDEILSSMGFGEDEAKVYLTTLRMGARPASLIAKKAGFKRGKIYTILQNLTERGLVQTFERRGTTFFSAAEPEVLMSLCESQELELLARKKKLGEMIPQLHSLLSPSSGGVKVRFFRGFEATKEMFETLLRATDEKIFAFVDLELVWADADDAASEWLDAWLERRKEKGVWFYGITKKSPTWEKRYLVSKNDMRKLKLMEDSDIPAEICIAGDKVVMFTMADEICGVMIDSPHIARTLQSVHQTLWHFLPDYKI